MDGIKEALGYFTSGEAKEALIQLGPLALPLFAAVVESIMGYNSVQGTQRRERLWSIIAGGGFALSAHLASRSGEGGQIVDNLGLASAGGYAIGALLGMVRNR